MQKAHPAFFVDKHPDFCHTDTHLANNRPVKRSTEKVPRIEDEHNKFKKSSLLRYK